ncbi:MAG: hypothetical protein Q4F65_12095 [Propionibacteriaceae bacterium]|nr:hypothetical protein [Propionibacteriaceae bacterium]
MLSVYEKERRAFDNFIARYGKALEESSDDYGIHVESPGEQSEFEAAYFSALGIAARGGVDIDDDTLDFLHDNAGSMALKDYVEEYIETIRKNRRTTTI